MPTPTYIPLGTITLASTDSQIVFSSIPATYRDLIIVADYALNTNGVVVMNFNNTTTNLSRVRMLGNSVLGAYSDAASDSNISEYKTTDSRVSILLNIMDYSTTDKHTSFLAKSNGLNRVIATALRWGVTDVVNSVRLDAGSQTFSIGSTFDLFGVK